MSVENFNKMCRICGEIFKGRCETIREHERQVYKYLPIKKDDSKFPKNLCMDCVASIVSWNLFYSRCDEAQKKFSSMLKKKSTLNNQNEASPMLDKSTNILRTNTKETSSKKPTVEGDGNLQETTKESDTSFACNFCTFRTKDQPQLNDHLFAIHCDLVFFCDLCKNYKPRDDLITHMTEHAFSSLQQPAVASVVNTSPSKIKCPKCDKQFVSNGGLKYHMNSSHNSTKPFACDECKHTFSCKRVLLNHVRSVHSKDKQFQCIDCDKRFKTDSTLYAHRKTHSKETPYKCFDCGKGFKFKHHLDMHAMQHKANKKSFECNCCHKKFAALNNLTKHRKIHDKTIDYSCHICGIKMLQKRYLSDHMKRVHQTKLDNLETTN